MPKPSQNCNEQICSLLLKLQAQVSLVIARKYKKQWGHFFVRFLSGLFCMVLNFCVSLLMYSSHGEYQQRINPQRSKAIHLVEKREEQL